MVKKTDEKIINQAHERFKRCEEYESKARQNFIFDIKFANGDSENLYQWPDNVANSRTAADRPCLTINKTRQHCLQIINDQRQNQSEIEIRPVGNGASYEAAKIYEGVVRHIEYISNASAAYANATYGQVMGGIGYWRVVTDYADHNSFDQEIYIRRVSDPLSVYIDPDIQEADGSDAKFAFVYKEISKEEFDAEYPDPDEEDSETGEPLGITSPGNFEDEHHIKVCEYYTKSDEVDYLYEMPDGTVVKASDVDLFPEHHETIKASAARKREITNVKINWYLIAGKRIIDTKEWPGKYIPIVRVVGEETVIDKHMDRHGHVRALIDPQRIYNYWSSSAVEQVALIGKSPYIAPIEAIENFQDVWHTANLENHAFLPYRSMTESGVPIEKPERTTPAQMAPAYLQGMQIAKDELMMASGQYEANMGIKSNEVSGKAVDARQRQGANSTYHYITRFSDAIRFTGRILIDLIPKVYDTQRVIKILAIDGEQSTVAIDPTHPQAHQQVQDPAKDDYDPQKVTAIFNPGVGDYDVEADIGPAYATRRQEEFNALVQIIQGNESLMPIIGDLLFKAADFPGADEAAERLRNMVSKQALGAGPDPLVQKQQEALNQQHASLLQMNQKVQQAQEEARQARLEQMQTQAKLMEAQQKTQIAQYEAETKRLAAAGNIDPAALQVIVRGMVQDMMNTPINPVIARHQFENAMMHDPTQPTPQQTAMQAQAQAAGQAAGTPLPQDPSIEQGPTQQ